METHLQDIAETIKAVVEEQLDEIVVTQVMLEGDIDHDGDPILRVQIIVEVPENGIDPRKSRGLIRHLREPLNDFANMGFPVISMISKDEYSPEAA